MKNIKIAYILTYLDNSWFWLGIWLLYYLQFSDYAGVGILETTAFLSLTLAELPTGAFADLFGKKKTLILGFILSALASFIMGFSTHFFHLVISLITLGVGHALKSGTFEALIYDSLLDEKKASSFGKVMGHIGIIKNSAFAVSAAVGGFLYKINPGLPFNVLGTFFLASAVVCLFLTEPHQVDAIFSIKKYIEQTRKGFQMLFSPHVIKSTTALLSVVIFTHIAYQLLDSALALEFGFEERQLGLLASIIYISSAIASSLTPRMLQTLKPLSLFLFLGMLAALSLLISPVLSLFIGGIVLVVRQSMFTVMENLTSVVINQNTPSSIRATTISTFNLLKNIPYVFSAFMLGKIIDSYSAKTLAVGLALCIFVSTAITFLRKSDKSLLMGYTKASL